MLKPRGQISLRSVFFSHPSTVCVPAWRHSAFLSAGFWDLRFGGFCEMRRSFKWSTQSRTVISHFPSSFSILYSLNLSIFPCTRNNLSFHSSTHPFIHSFIFIRNPSLLALLNYYLSRALCPLRTKSVIDLLCLRKGIS